MVLRTPDQSLTDSQGLSSAQAGKRLREDGPNALAGAAQRTLFTIVLETAQDPMFLLLLAAGCLYLLLGDLQEGVA